MAKAADTMDYFVGKGETAVSTSGMLGAALAAVSSPAAAASTALGLVAGALDRVGLSGGVASLSLHGTAAAIGGLATAISVTSGLIRLVGVLRALGAASWLSAGASGALRAAMLALNSPVGRTALGIGVAVVGLYGLYRAARAAAGAALYLAGALASTVGFLARTAVAAAAAGVSIGAVALKYVLLAAAAGVGALAALAGQGIRYVDAMTDVAAVTNMGVAAIIGLDYAATYAGSSSETMTAALTKMTVKIGELAAGSEGAVSAFGRIGLAAADLEGLGGADQFAKIADGIAALPTPAEQAAAAVQIFGRSGAELAPLLAGGAKAIQDLAKEADALGLTVNEVEAAKIGEAWDGVQKLGSALQGLANQIAAQLAPYIISVSKGILDWAKSSQFARVAAGTLINLLIEGARFLGEQWDFFKLGISGLQIIFAEVGIVASQTFQQIIGWMIAAAKTFDIFGTGAAEALESVQSAAKDMENSLQESSKEGMQQIIKDMKSGLGTGEAWANTLKNLGKASQTPFLPNVSEFNKELGKASEKVDQILESMRDRNATFGMSEIERQLYEIKKLTNDPKYLDEAMRLTEEAKRLQEKKDAIKAAADEQERLNKLAADYIKDTRSSGQKYLDEIKQIESLVGRNGFTKEMAERAKLQARGRFESEVKFDPTKAAGAAEKGSREAYTAIRLFNAPRSVEEMQLKTGRDQLAVQRDQLAVQKKIAAKPNPGLKARR